MRGKIYAVHYGDNKEVTMQFIASLQPYLSNVRELVLVNNGVEGLFKNCLLPYVTILDSATNLGYFGGIKWAMTKFPVGDLDYVMLCNNDILLNSPDFFAVLEAKLQDWDVLAPSTKTLDGVEQNPHRECKTSWFRKIYYRIYFSNYIFAWLCVKLIDWKKKKLVTTVNEQSERGVFSPHGACIILNTNYFKSGGVIDDNTFLYGEEDSIAAMSAELGLRVGFVPALKVLHQESISTGKSLSPAKYKHQKAAYTYTKKTYRHLY